MEKTEEKYGRLLVWLAEELQAAEPYSAERDVLSKVLVKAVKILGGENGGESDFN